VLIDWTMLKYFMLHETCRLTIKLLFIAVERICRYSRESFDISAWSYFNHLVHRLLAGVTGWWDENLGVCWQLTELQLENIMSAGNTL